MRGLMLGKRSPGARLVRAPGDRFGSPAQATLSLCPGRFARMRCQVSTMSCGCGAEHSPCDRRRICKLSERR